MSVLLQSKKRFKKEGGASPGKFVVSGKGGELIPRIGCPPSTVTAILQNFEPFRRLFHAKVIWSLILDAAI